MSFKDDLIRFAKDLELERDAALGLWTWLPSYRAAKKGHGDYADEFMPSTEDLMKEASACFSLIGGYGLNSSNSQKIETVQNFLCPCYEENCPGHESFDQVSYEEFLLEIKTYLENRCDNG